MLISSGPLLIVRTGTKQPLRRPGISIQFSWMRLYPETLSTVVSPRLPVWRRRFSLSWITCICPRSSSRCPIG
ncbi:hypothetical protein [Marine gokushovirus]|nr:hypothetical protein [Marine gokushovirus]